MSKITVKFITLGCKTNLYESEGMASLFRAAGYQVVSGKEKADVCVVNTCTVTGTGAQKSRQQIRRARRENPGAVLAVTGCLAQTEADRLREDMDIDILIGNKYRNQIVELVELALRGIKTDKITPILKETDYEELGVTHSQSRVRANLKIEDGCNNFCTYCIIPYARGPVRSRSMVKILEEAQALGEAGYGEIVLTGIHLGSYGRDLGSGTGLIDVIEAVHRIEGIRRLRLGSLEPVMITEDFVRRAAQLPKLCPQFHLSLQSGCDATLKRMNRHYTTVQFRNAVELLRKSIPDTAITTDLMVGFAGETDAEFQESYAFCESIAFAQMHIFPYSIRQGTAAAAFPDQVEESVKTDRTHQMLFLAEHMKKAFYQKYIGSTASVLLEQEKNGRYHGTTANYMDVLVNGPTGMTGRIADVTLSGIEDQCLTGRIV
ncbi:tRNA (N(6)-L-threonylcarbamoyladenosine(37)-C(2))-methylthiotransferase MtaB [Ructibacterium gallinarum]|uniref:tRNA (N(6)-L-threonylcarbamoyladenosine(37)-C(2))-methylthiotransferase n=1 Tax=Ructibacterium gallinarum TaxID=2779355 RepID=A0A9D5R8Q5_9FIRM|nr:tRNA (N(6)-L-threonylcarbamoyladenosine(37)-C(2))-methylthiotransferase MtaB [Ructibacterium gallinarum]MBE5040240.1 tRNA (N(6)-L-threonylcarbamoyladenosine(37)-C(2))-methylthiotransferase MtaB [Ructibacterium gallinarum]